MTGREGPEGGERRRHRLGSVRRRRREAAATEETGRSGSGSVGTSGLESSGVRRRWWVFPHSSSSSSSCAIVLHPAQTQEGIRDEIRDGVGDKAGGLTSPTSEAGEEGEMERRRARDEEVTSRRAARARNCREEEEGGNGIGSLGSGNRRSDGVKPMDRLVRANSGPLASSGEGNAPCRLPDHLIESVVARLPVQSMFRFRAVSRAWNSLLHSRTFLAANAEAAAQSRHSIWFLVANLGRVGRSGHRIVATYDPRDDQWLSIPLPAPLRDLNPYPTAADGGLVCYFVYENRLRTLFVCNPLTRSLRKLPQVLKASSHISVLKMWTSPATSSTISSATSSASSASEYKVFVAGMVPGENGGDSLVLEVYDSASNSWAAGGIIPARYPKRRPVFANGVLYVRCYDQRSLLLTYDMKLNLWSRHHAPLPPTLGYEELVEYKGRVMLVGVLEERYQIKGVCIWELGPQQPKNREGMLGWKQVGAMPAAVFADLFADRDFFQCQEEERVLMKCCHYGDFVICVAFNISHKGPFRLVAYDLLRGIWMTKLDAFRADSCRTHKFIEGVIYEPRLDAVA